MSAPITSSNRLYIGNLPLTMDKEQVEIEFKQFGPVQSVWIAKNPPGFGFVEYETEEPGAAAVKGMDGREFSGQRMRVEFAKPREPGSRGGRGGGGGGGGFERGGRDDRAPYGGGGRDGGYDRAPRDDRDDRRRDDRGDDRRGDDRRGGGAGAFDPRAPNPYAAYAAYAAHYAGAGGYPAAALAPYGMPNPYGASPYGMPPAHAPYGADPRDLARGGAPGAYGAHMDAPPRGYGRDERDGRGYGRDDRGDGQRRGMGPPQGREHICFNCNQTGHWAKDCSKPKNSGECYTCGKRGHAQRDCPEGSRPPQQQGGGESQQGNGGARRSSRSRSPAGRASSRSRSRSRGRGRSPPSNGGQMQQQMQQQSSGRSRSRSPRK